MKQGTNSFEITSEDKRLLNMLEIKMYDISQNVEIIGKQLTNNQIKDVIANTYNIFCQLKRIFQNAGIKELYDVIKKMQINSVVLTSILTERIDKKIDQAKIKSPEALDKPVTKEMPAEPQTCVEGKPKASKLGGICLYNQSYIRGLQYYQVDTESLEQMSGKFRIKQSKKSKDDFLNSVSRELDAKADVQVQTIADQIKKYIKDYKQNSKINSFVSYEKQLIQLIDFFKISELEAMNFLNKSPKNQEYTEDYINRLNDLESEFKLKEKTEKLSINEKLKLFIFNLKEKLHEMQQKYQQKNTKLHLFQQSLKKETCSTSTQTYDGLQSRLKSQQLTIKELEQRYKILSEIKNKEVNFESKYYEIFHELNVKNADINKIKNMNTELESEIQYLKKIIRDNKEKLNIDLKDFEKRRNKNKKITKETSKKQIEENQNDRKDSIPINDVVEMDRRSSKMEKKTKRLERVGVQTSSLFRPSELQELSKEIAKDPQLEKNSQIVKDNDQNQMNEETYKNIKVEPKKSIPASLPNKQVEVKESFFKNEFKKNSKKASEEERQVSFLEQKSKRAIIQNIQDNSCQITPANISIDNIKTEYDENEYEESSQRNSKKTLRQMLHSSGGCSMWSIEGQAKKSFKNVSKKCIILKDNKQKDKNLLATTIKLEHLKINDAFKITIYPQPQAQALQRLQRPSYPFTNIQQSNSGISIKSTTKLNQLSNEINKVKINHQSTYNGQRIKSIESQEKISLLETLKKRDYVELVKKSLSKKENQQDGSVSKHYLPMESEIIAIHNQQKNKKGQRSQASKYHQNLQSKSIKDITNYLENLKTKSRDVSLSQKVSQLPLQNWGNSLDQSQAGTFVDYIIDELSKQQLNFQEFKEIVNCINEIKSHSEYFASQPNKKQHEHSSPLFKEFQQTQIKKDSVIHSKRYSKLKDKDLKEIKEVKEPFKLKKEEIYGIGERIYLNIREIHKRMSNCHSKDNRPCEHLMKYLSILRKVNEAGNQKHAIKLHIQKIGELLDDSFGKSHKRSMQDLKQVEKLQNLLAKSNTSYVKAALDQSIEQQRDRILPIINTTSSTYYKPKNKQFIVK